MMRNDYYLNGGIPTEIAENLKDIFPEHGDLSYEEVLLQQESVYQSIQANGRNKDKTSDHGQSSDLSQFSGQEGESSRSRSVESQLALDEALARSLQELGEDFDDFCISELSGTAAGSREINPPRESPVRVSVLTQDDIDPDSMTYEQLQSLGETVGTESKGLSKKLISQLPTFKYKSGWFSKKKNKEDCVICCMAYEGRDQLIMLPCVHQYHSKCIKRWLKLNKNCPICQEEVKSDQP